MAGTRRTNTMQEGLMALLSDLAQMKAAPDADLDMLSTMESQILQAIKAPQQQAMMQLAAAGGVVPGMGGGPPPGMGGGPPGGGMPPGMPGPQAMGGPAPGSGSEGIRGVRNGGSLPPIGDLRALIAKTQAGQA